MPERRDRDAAIAAALEEVAQSLRDGDATVYGYDVAFEPRPFHAGGVNYPGGWFEFRFELAETAPLDADQ